PPPPPPGPSRCASAGAGARQDPRLPEEHQPLTVAHIEALQLVALLGVVQAAVCEHAIDVHDERADTAPARARAAHASGTPVDMAPSATTNGSAISATATSTTSGSPKLSSNRPATRKAPMAACTPTTSVRSGPSGRRRTSRTV